MSTLGLLYCRAETVKKSLGPPGKWRAKHTRKDLYWCFFVIWSTSLQSKRNFGRFIWTFRIGRWLTIKYARLTAMTNLCRRPLLPRAGNPCESKGGHFKSPLSYFFPFLTESGRFPGRNFTGDENMPRKVCTQRLVGQKLPWLEKLINLCEQQFVAIWSVHPWTFILQSRNGQKVARTSRPEMKGQAH